MDWETDLIGAVLASVLLGGIRRALLDRRDPRGAGGMGQDSVLHFGTPPPHVGGLKHDVCSVPREPTAASPLEVTQLGEENGPGIRLNMVPEARDLDALLCPYPCKVLPRFLCGCVIRASIEVQHD